MQPGDAGSIVTLVGLAGTATIRIGARVNGADAEIVGTDVTKAAVPQAMELVRQAKSPTDLDAALRMERDAAAG